MNKKQEKIRKIAIPEEIYFEFKAKADSFNLTVDQYFDILLGSCKHCPNNTNAQKPLTELVQVSNIKELDLASKSENCKVCIAVKALSMLPKEKQLTILKN